MSEPTKFYLFKRANGHYYILYVEDGRKHWKSAGSDKKAEELKALSSFRDLAKKKPQSVPFTRQSENRVKISVNWACSRFCVQAGGYFTLPDALKLGHYA